MNGTWRNSLRLLVRAENVFGTTLQQAIKDNGGSTAGIGEGGNGCIVTLRDVTVEVLDERIARDRLAGTSYTHLQWSEQTDLKTVYRLTLSDGQRLIYVQCADCYESFLVQDSHVSFERERG